MGRQVGVGRGALHLLRVHATVSPNTVPETYHWHIRRVVQVSFSPVVATEHLALQSIDDYTTDMCIYT